MAKMENIGKCKLFDYQMITFSCLSMISVLSTGSGYSKKPDNHNDYQAFNSIRHNKSMLNSHNKNNIYFNCLQVFIF